jgi:hypothetical protein
VRHSGGITSQSHRPAFDAVTVGDARGGSTKQPPAIPVAPGQNWLFQNKVVPQMAQNHLSWRLALAIS